MRPLLVPIRSVVLTNNMANKTRQLKLLTRSYSMIDLIKTSNKSNDSLKLLPVKNSL